MPYVVDGNNLLGSLSGRGRPSAEEKSRLIRQIAERLRAVRSRVVVVFDGPSETGRIETSLGPLSIRYSGDRSADDVIAAIAAAAARPKEQHVVTDDRGLTARIRGAGSVAVSTAEFWARFAGSEAAVESPRSVDVDDWLEFFADDQNRLD